MGRHLFHWLRARHFGTNVSNIPGLGVQGALGAEFFSYPNTAMSNPKKETALQRRIRERNEAPQAEAEQPETESTPTPPAVQEVLDEEPEGPE